MSSSKTHPRMQHPQAKLIPQSVWEAHNFSFPLPGVIAELMTLSTKDIQQYTKYKEVPPRLRNEVWLGFALAHPDLELSTLEFVAEKIDILNKGLFLSLLMTVGNQQQITAFLKRSYKALGMYIPYDNYLVYRLTAGRGNIDTLRFLEDAMPGFFPIMLGSGDYAAYLMAAKNGHRSILEYLEARLIKENSKAISVQEMVDCSDFLSYRMAALAGHDHILEYLEKKFPKLLPSMIEAQNFGGYQMAAKGGHLEMLKRMEATAGPKAQKMIDTASFSGYVLAAEENHVEILGYLMYRSNICFALAEKHLQEYGRFVLPFIQEQLDRLQEKSLASIGEQGVFDLTDSSEAIRCFYMLRHLIRFGERAFDDSIRFLLGIPAVKILVHQNITLAAGMPGQDNELLRLALTANHEVAQILLGISAVRNLAEQNNYYARERKGALDLARLAQDNEASMTALATGEQERLGNALEHYQPKLITLGVPAIMEDLRETLWKRYEAKPAIINIDDDKTIKLPLHFDAFENLKLGQDDSNSALKSYYQHKDHTAFRYLSKPNLWMHPNADYVYKDTYGVLRWSTFEDYQQLIAMFWLAAKDEKMAPTEGHTLEGRIDQFIDELAHIGRTHNWHKSTGREDECDDLKGDRPSCFSGVKRRLFQSVVGHPLINLLTKDIILEEIRAFARTFFENLLTEKGKHALEEAYNDYICNTNGLSAESKNELQKWNIPDEKISTFKKYLIGKYGSQFTEDRAFIKLVEMKLELKPAPLNMHYHVLTLDGFVKFHTLFNETRTAKASETGLFAKKTRESSELKEKPLMEPS